MSSCTRPAQRGCHSDPAQLSMQASTSVRCRISARRTEPWMLNSLEKQMPALTQNKQEKTAGPAAEGSQEDKCVSPASTQDLAMMSDVKAEPGREGQTARSAGQLPCEPRPLSPSPEPEVLTGAHTTSPVPLCAPVNPRPQRSKGVAHGQTCARSRHCPARAAMSWTAF